MEAVRDILKDYFETKSEVVAAYLFGSYARGKEEPSSDIDVAVLFNKNDDSFCRRTRETLLLELSRVTRKDVDVVVLNSANLTVLQQVFSRGICLMANDKQRLAVFKMVAFSEIADFAYFRTGMESRFVEEVLGG
jgi:predicted nucleotidyltransferase